MKLQTTPLAHATEYFFDGAVDEGELDSGSAVALRLYGDRDKIDETIERKRPGNRYMILENRRATNHELARYASELIAQLPNHQQGALIAMSLAHAKYSINGLAEILSSWAIGDSVEGGYMEPFSERRISAVAESDGVTPTKKIQRRLRSAKWIGRYVKHNDSADHCRDFAQSILVRTYGLPWDQIHGGIEAFENELAEVKARQEEAIRRAYSQLEIERAITAVSGNKQIQRQKMRAYKKTLRRSAAMVAAILGVTTASAFAHGKPVQIAGEQILFQVSKFGSLARVGHGGLNISVLSLSGAKLAGLCLYFDKTPAFDQLVALALHVQNGCEKEILSAANITSITPKGADHPLLKERNLARERHLCRSLDNWRVLNTDNLRQQQTVRDATYWSETKDVWIERLSAFVLGTQGYKLLQEVCA